ncbi:MAG: hypothetical protein FIB08_00875 [Candidatus Methanoperedens sp.]|nr:hypothetical protein [Candidatus Methanoperedens sp.]
MKPKSIELHIEELVLDGFSPGDHLAISESVERELSRMFAEQESPQLMEQSGKIESLQTGKFDIKENSKDDVIGVQLARTIYGGLKK